MINGWWLLWLFFIFMCLAPPIGYGWGYRGWGAPYPRYVQRRRTQRLGSNDGSVSFDHEAWGWGGDFIWIMVLILIFSTLAAFLVSL